MITYTVNIDYGEMVQEGMTLPEALRELGCEISYLDDVIQMLERTEEDR